jgi:DNA-binding transcriptional regulator YhcF (GntR family)
VTERGSSSGSSSRSSGSSSPRSGRIETLHLEADSPLAPFEQLKRQVTDGATSGSLPHGTRLPTVRALADELGLAANTVAKAYRELEADGVIETRGRAGSFVAWSADSAESELERLASAFAARADALGIPRARARAIADAALR